MKLIRNILKRNFITGFLILVPIGATFTLLRYIVAKSDDLWKLIPAPARPETYLGFEIPGLSLVLAFFFIVLIGVLGRMYIVKLVISQSEKVIKKIPVISAFYSAVKQLLDTIFVSKEVGDKRKVVLVEFPRKGVYSVGFLTAVASGETQEKTAAKVVNIFIPTTPNPTSGFLIMVPETEVMPLKMTVEDAFKLIMSGGIITPSYQKNSPAAE